MRNTPNLFCLGAQKAGTTALYSILKQSNEVFFSKEKEIHFFDIPENFNKGINWYLSFFDSEKEFKFYADFAPDYLIYDFVPERLKEICDCNTKFIVMLRNPVDRAYSQYQFFKSFGAEKSASYMDAFNRETDLKDSSLFKTLFEPKYYILRGNYVTQIKRYLKYFELNQFKFVLYEDFSKSPEFVVKDICIFLDIKNFDFVNKLANETRVSYKTNISDKIRSKHPVKKFFVRIFRTIIPSKLYHYIKLKIYYLVFRPPVPMKEMDRKVVFEKFYKNEIKELEELTKLDLSIWLNSFK